MGHTNNLSVREKKWIGKTIEEIKESWLPELGYGWSSVQKAREVFRKHLERADYSNALTQKSLEQWGIEGERIGGSPFAFIGTWASMLDYYYDSYFSHGSTTTKSDLDKQVLWSQQAGALPLEHDSRMHAEMPSFTKWNSNSINTHYRQSETPEDLFTLLQTEYRRNKSSFKAEAWTSLINIAGPGERTLHDLLDESLQTITIKSLAKEIVGRNAAYDLDEQLQRLDSYTTTANVAWMEDLFSRQKTPIFMFNKLNRDELEGVRQAVLFREELLEDSDDWLLSPKAKGSPWEVALFLYRNLLECFYNSLYEVKSSDSSTIQRLTAVKNAHQCIKISGLLKNPCDTELEIVLTGTGKEFFYLLAKGATPYLCGEFLILSLLRNPTELASKLVAIPTKLKNDLEAHYQPMKDPLNSYRKLTGSADSKMPFMVGTAGQTAASLLPALDWPSFATQSSHRQRRKHSFSI